MPSPASDEDLNDIMSRIMNPSRDTSPRSDSNHSGRSSRPPVTTQKPVPANKHVPHRTKSHSKKSSRRFIRVFAVFIVVVTLLFAAGYWSRDYVTSLLKPPSPFVGKVAAQQFPLYFPTKLPEGFKIELGSISQPESNIVVYAISDDKEQRIHISLQAAPEDLNLDPVENTFSNKRVVPTSHGDVTVGINKVGSEMANVVADKTWIIINSPKGLLSNEEFDLILDSFIKGSTT